ncbi:MAG: HEAT repeat domain-containing protein [Verrucomicrobiota bacterium]|nr:HEAT repeat domain-containing protein [Verrucomicrobiota bacterium]
MTDLGEKENRIGVLTTDVSLKVRSWDDWLVAATGLKPESVIGRSLSELFPELIQRGLISRLLRVVNEGTPEVLAPAFHGCFIPCPPMRPSGRFDRMQQKVHIAPLMHGDAIVGAIATIEDVTERRERELDLAENLSSTDENTRVSAARELAAAGTSSVPDLLRAMGDSSWRVRRAVADGLAKAADKSIVPELVRVLREQHQDAAVLNSALSVLAASNVDVVGPLSELLSDRDAATRTYAALAMGLLNDKTAVPPLIHATADLDPNVRYHAIEALGQLRAKEASERLLEIAETRDFFLAYPAIDALKSIGDISIVPRLVPLLEDDTLCTPVAETLGELGDARTVQPLVALLNRRSARIAPVVHALLSIHDRYQVVYGEGEYVASIVRENITENGIDALLSELDQKRGVEIGSFVRILGWMESETATRRLASLLAQREARAEVVEALVRHGKHVTHLLIDQLQSPDVEVQHAAAAALGRIGDPQAVPALIGLLNSTEELAVVAAGSLARIGDHRAFGSLIQLLGHPCSPVRQAAISALNSLGHPELEHRVTDLLRNPNNHVRESAACIACYFGFESCTEQLFELCSDADENVRRAAVQGIGYLDHPRVPDILSEVISKDSPRVRAAAAQALANLPPTQAAALLMSALRDPDFWVRYYAAQALGQLGVPESLEPLASLASGDPVPHVRIAALRAIGRIGGQRAVAILAPATQSDNPDIASAAIESLGQVAHPDALPPLLAALKAPDLRKQIEAAHALGKHGGPGTAGALQWAAALHNEPEIIKAALEALARQGTPEAISALIALCVDPSRREMVVSVLSQTGEKNMDLVAKGLGHPKPAVRIAIVSALARMKSPRASRRICDALDDPDSSVRLAAMSALASLRSLESERRLAQLAATDPDPAVRRMAREAFQGQKPTRPTNPAQ